MAASNRLFQQVGAFRPGRTPFNLSYRMLLTADPGLLYPVCVKELVPGDVIEVGSECEIRMMPSVAPILHPMWVTFHWFAVPYRILDDGSFDWESFITGGEDGTDAQSVPTLAGPFPLGDLDDHFGYPTAVALPAGFRPSALPRYSYNEIYNEFYRDQNIITTPRALTASTLARRAWSKDYFTSCLPWQTRGSAPSLPITGSTVFDGDVDLDYAANTGANQTTMTGDNVVNRAYDNFTQSVLESGAAPKTAYGTYGLDDNEFTGATANMATWRLAIATQQWLERNARAGARYPEFIYAHFGTVLKDYRAQRPEFIGGCRFPITISEIAKTGDEGGSDPLATLAGHGLAADASRCGRYRATEYGLVMCLMSIMPKAAYSEGIERTWLQDSRYDFYHPEFAHLSEQPVYEGELYAQTVLANNTTIFGYQGIYDHHRVSHDRIAGLMRTTFDHWHLGRQLGARPTLNQSFIECTARTDWLATPAEPAFVCNVGNLIRAVRPMPALARPGLRRF